MSKKKRITPPPAVAGFQDLWKAFDTVRFGTANTLNLRESLPTADEAERRAEPWLRQKQVEKAGEVLVITGRGNNSETGVSRVRETVIRVLHSLRRQGVVADFQEHTAGSFVVSLAPVTAMLDAGKRRREKAPEPKPEPPSLDALDAETRVLLRDLAERALDQLGMRVHDYATHVAYVEAEMVRQFGRLAAAVGAGPDREPRLRAAIRAAMDEYDF